MADTTTDSGDRYTVTARKYRPQTFDDLVAQEHVAETFRNAITRDRLAHVYLLCGPRGVGKTTAARLIAKAVNCQTPLSERDRAEPCRTCDSCHAFEQGRSLNVFEIDAASNNGVDYMRDLRDKALVPPQGAKKKVYILDEVHMLSASAFNALLKLLEEPPSYVMFIFATTEPHKVLPTILSRSQRFDFRRISVPEIVARLREIAEAEGVEADEESLVLLARKGDGALRDALSVYDQAVSVCGQTLEIGALRQALGVVDADVYFAVTDRAQAGDRAGLLSLVDGVVRAGHDLDELVHGLADHLRNLLVARSTGSGDLIEGTDATRTRYLQAAAPYAEADLLHLLMLAEATANDLRESRQPRLTLELALLKMASLESAANLDRLLDRLASLEAAAAAGTLPTESAGAQTPSPSAMASTAPAPTPGETSARAPAAATPPVTPATQTAEPSTPYTAPPASPEPAAALATPPGPSPQPHASETPAAEPRPAYDESNPPPHTDDPPTRQALEDDADDDDGGLLASPSSPRPAPPAPQSDTPAPAPRARPSLFGAPALRRSSGGDGHTATLAPLVDTPDVPSGGDGHAGPAPADPLGPALAAMHDAWPQFVAAVRERVGVRVGAIVQAGSPIRVARGAVEIGMDDAFGVRVATDNDAALCEVLADIVPDAPPVRWVVAPSQTAETAAAADPFEALKQMRQSHPVVRALFEKFGAEIVWQ